MRKTGMKLILIAVLSLAALALVSNASSPSTGTGAALLQFGCGEDPNFGLVYGPAAITINSSGTCSPYANLPGPIPVPAGRLYHLRVNPEVGTVDGSIPNVQFTVYDGLIPTPITCTTTTLPPVCDDFAHQYSVKSGDLIWINVTVPNSNTEMRATAATVEEAVFQ
jgi:hypothetical protein